MKKHFTFLFVTVASLVLVLSSCSQQVYTYRSKVKVKHETELAKKETEKVNQIATKQVTSKETQVSMATPAEGLVQPVEVKVSKQTAKAQKKAVKIAEVIERMVPGKTGVANILANHSKKDLAKSSDVKAAAAQGIDAKKWMIVGLIIMLGAVVLGLLTGYTFFYGIGALIFVIGLVFYLLEALL
jgi:hypothetical protein